MVPPQEPPRTNTRPKRKTPAERAEECIAVQRQLKQDAADRRALAASAAGKRGTAQR